MSQKYPCRFTAEELAANAKNKRYDQILIVEKDLHTKVKKIEDIFQLTKWTEKDVWSDVYKGNCSSAWMNEFELKFVEPGDEDTPWKRFADKYNEGICCVREVIGEDKWESEKARIAALSGKDTYTFEDETGLTVVFDFTDKFGGYYAIHKNSAERVYPEESERNARKLVQINVTTTDVDETVYYLTELLEAGPWSIGTLNNTSVSNPGVLVDGKLTAPEFHFQLGITLVGNLEFEVIQPVKGPTVYKKYIDRRGTGYHHIKEIVPADKMQQKMDEYEKDGMPIAIKGTVDITSFAYIDSEKDFGFYVEFGDGLPPHALPDGYNEYIYPQD